MSKQIKILCLVVALIAVGVLIRSNDSKPVTNSTEPIKIGVAASLTGFAANWGEGELKAFEIAVDDYKDKIKQPIELVVQDTKTDGTGTVNAVKKLIDVDHVQVVLGPTWGDSFQGPMPIAEQSRVVLLSPSAAIETIQNKENFSYFFSTWWPQASEIKTLLDHMTASGVTRLAVVNDQDPFDIQFADSLVAAAEAMGKKDFIVSRITVPISTKDFRTYIAKIKAANPEGAFIQLQDTSTMGPFMKQAKELGLNIKVYGTPDAENTDNIKKFPGYFDGLYYAFPSYGQDVSYAVLLKKLTAKYGADVSQGPSFVNAYNAATMLMEVIKGGARTGTEIRDALNKVHVAGVGSKNLSFNSSGQLENTVFIMKQIQNNQFVEIK